jgi:hypothetical protein
MDLRRFKHSRIPIICSPPSCCVPVHMPKTIMWMKKVVRCFFPSILVLPLSHLIGRNFSFQHNLLCIFSSRHCLIGQFSFRDCLSSNTYLLLSPCPFDVGWRSEFHIVLITLMLLFKLKPSSVQHRLNSKQDCIVPLPNSVSFASHSPPHPVLFFI